MQTAELLREAGRAAWALPRDDMVVAKGKGKMTTFWLDDAAARREGNADETCSSMRSVDDIRRGGEKDRASHLRLVEWNTEQLLGLLKKIVAFRGEGAPVRVTVSAVDTFKLQEDHTYLDEVAEVIELPKSSGRDFEGIDVTGVKIERVVVDELRLLVKTIAAMYNDCPFHNFVSHAEHSSQSQSHEQSLTNSPTFLLVPHLPGTC